MKLKELRIKPGEFKLNSPQILLIGFASLILAGAIILALPIASQTGESIGFLDALFTSASAVCVTGLIVVDTPTAFSVYGQTVIMLLIQVGGLGFMTFGVIFSIILGRRIGFKERLLLQQSTQSLSAQGVVKLSISIVLIAFIFESIAAAVLTIRWMPEYGFSQALYYAVFHAISSFNNAGFSLWSDSLSRYAGDPVVNIVISLLFIVGGIGFTVIMDVYRKRSWRELSLHSKIVLTATASLIAFGVAAVFALEAFNPKTLGSMPWPDRLWASYFQGVVTRTAGFNTIDIAAMTMASQFIFIFLMFIGASSGSTGGGIKTNTFAVLLLSVITVVRGRGDFQLYRRRITIDLILRSLAVIIISLGVVIVSTFLLTLTEHTQSKNFISILFEATSAFGTVGLSMGLTYELSPLGKWIIIFTMFIGRLGPLTLAFALAQNVNKQYYRYPEEKILIG